MDVLGWGLFLIGALLLIVFAFIGIDVGGSSVTNLAGTLVGSAMMISGAVFIVGDKVVRAIKGKTEGEAQSVPLPETPMEGPTSKKEEFVGTAIAVVVLLLVGLLITFFGISVQGRN